MSSKRQAWLEALRSGEYKQGEGALKRLDSYSCSIVHCCLGVACEVVAPDRFTVKPVQYEKYEFIGENYDDELGTVKVNLTGAPPDDVLKALGINHEEMNDLIDMNDRQHRDFDYIANYVEA